MRKKQKVVGLRIGEFEGEIKSNYREERKDIGTRPIPRHLKEFVSLFEPDYYYTKKGKK